MTGGAAGSGRESLVCATAMRDGADTENIQSQALGPTVQILSPVLHAGDWLEHLYSRSPDTTQHGSIAPARPPNEKIPESNALRDSRGVRGGT